MKLTTCAVILHTIGFGLPVTLSIDEIKSLEVSKFSPTGCTIVETTNSYICVQESPKKIRNLMYEAIEECPYVTK